jgi:hypothetical protein
MLETSHKNDRNNFQDSQDYDEYDFQVSVALVHAPVVNKQGFLAASSITNYDIHDIARACRTYDVLSYGIISPDETQIQLAQSILTHWTSGPGAKINPDRKTALENVSCFSSLTEMQKNLTHKYGKVVTILTRAGGALPSYSQKSFQEVREKWCRKPNASHILLVFGTAWGLAPELWQEADTTLDPIRPKKQNSIRCAYNHLSVRSAVSICLDRLMGDL